MFIVFLLTGQYMDKYHNHLADMEDLPRALMRAQHLYILLAALINMSLGGYLTISKDKIVRSFQIFGTILIIAATIMLILWFFKELPSDQIERPMCRKALYLMLAGVLGHGVPNLILSFTRQTPNQWIWGWKIIWSCSFCLWWVFSSQWKVKDNL